jgi:hypothetical protein
MHCIFLSCDEYEPHCNDPSFLLCRSNYWFPLSGAAHSYLLTVPIQTWAPYLPLSWCWVWARVARCLQPRLCADSVSSRSYGWFAWIAEVVPGSCWVPLCMLTDRYVKTGWLTIKGIILIPKPIWTYGIQLWGTTSNCNIEILERFQSKVLRLIVNAPWYVPNSVIRNDLRVPTVKEEISRFSSHYMFASVYTPMNLSPHSPSRQSTSACVDAGPTTCLSDSSNLY